MRRRHGRASYSDGRRGVFVFRIAQKKLCILYLFFFFFFVALAHWKVYRVYSTITHTLFLDLNDSELGERDVQKDVYIRCWKVFRILCEHRGVSHYVGMVRSMKVKTPATLVMHDGVSVETIEEINKMFEDVICFLGFSRDRSNISPRRSRLSGSDAEFLFNTV